MEGLENATLLLSLTNSFGVTYIPKTFMTVNFLVYEEY